MRDFLNHAIYGWYPYLCLTVFIVGSIVRFDREQYTWRSGSSQLLRRRQLMWGSNLFHVGILIIFLVMNFSTSGESVETKIKMELPKSAVKLSLDSSANVSINKNEIVIQGGVSVPIGPDGDVPEKDGQYLCPDCSTVVSFTSNEFQGYEVLERLGAGSAGLVFKARQLVLDRIVALKVLRQRQRRSARTEARFLREAATISKLEHPNIVRIFDASPFPKGYFIVMEYFQATDLQTLLERRVAIGHALRLATLGGIHDQQRAIAGR